MKKVLVAEDEDAIREFIVLNLTRSGYEVTEVSNGSDAIAEYEKAYTGNTGELFSVPYAVVMLDIMMPGQSGIEVCKYIRAKSKTTGIIILSAKSQEMDKINALMAGADDYITKPFSTGEMTARVDALWRRVNVSENAAFTELTDDNVKIAGPFRLDKKNCSVQKNGNLLSLSQSEYNLFEYFADNPEKAITREEILYNVWGEDYTGDDKVVDVNIRRLRVKIEDNPAEPKYLRTVWGAGYRFSAV
ncbi:MAG: response regulator transcription factor [Oscillospiraceae bacterium]|jgi:DNA-binding response OmpR family regulator|nr:response regulator transcription factor [Oscillospiraceae bacterium]